ncbi:MAG: glycosyltransferase family 4 protein [Planctomycetaceae bacterium]
MRLLFITTRTTKPSYRFRVEQVLPCFADRGHDCAVEVLPSSFFDRVALFKTAGEFDAVVLQKKLLNRLELGILFGFARKLIYDFDDAVMFDSDGEPDFRRSNRFENVARAADLVVCGNRCLAELARPFSKRTSVIPTPIDTDAFSPSCKPAAKTAETGLLRVGWTGSRSTNRYLDELIPMLARLRGKIELHVLSECMDGLNFAPLKDLPFEFVKWTPDNEAAETATFDVGLMPLPDNRWTRGKCGFKALQYMALGIPAVCSPVGVNREIIAHGTTGFLTRTDEEWVAVLSQLADDAALRTTVGEAGRRYAESEFALRQLGPNFVAAMESVVRDKAAAAA